MSNDDVSIPLGSQPYSDEQTVYRAAIYSDWLKRDDTVKHQAFFRLGKDTHGVSINPTPEDCKNNPDFTDPICGVIRIAVRQIRSVQREDTKEFLEVIPDSPTHGNIKRLPFRDDDRIEATRLARELANLARIHERL